MSLIFTYANSTQGEQFKGRKDIQIKILFRNKGTDCEVLNSQRQIRIFRFTTSFIRSQLLECSVKSSRAEKLFAPLQEMYGTNAPTSPTRNIPLLLRMKIWRVSQAIGYRKRSGIFKTPYIQTVSLSKRVSTSLGCRAPPVPPVQPVILPSHISIEEELVPDYDHRHFYPVNPGNVFHNRYEMTTKLGCGSFSTVWLARDTQRYALSPRDAILFNSPPGGSGSPIVLSP